MSILGTMTNHFGDIRTPYAAGITLLEILFYFVLIFNVGGARDRYKVEAPATDGPPAFRRIYRTHMNTLEQLMLHLPLLWIAVFAVGDRFAGAAGLIWLVGRIIYARAYYKDGKQRHVGYGFFIALFANLILLLGDLAGVTASF